jgi:hypothetical protein
MEDHMITGIAVGAVCALIVSFLGLAFVSTETSYNNGLLSCLSGMWKGLLRSALGLASVIVLVVLGANALVSGSFAFFEGFAAAYVIGVTLYFTVRYGFGKH